MQKGDWIELRDAPNTRGIVKSVHCQGRAPGCCKYHEMIHETDPVVTMSLSGDRGDHVVTLAEAKALWEPMRFTGDTTPWWCQKDAVFRPVMRDVKGQEVPWSASKPMARLLGKAKAVVLAVQPGWVAYLDSSDSTKPPVFFMTRWWEFRRMWEPVKPPNAWERVLRSED